MQNQTASLRRRYTDLMADTTMSPEEWADAYSAHIQESVAHAQALTQNVKSRLAALRVK